MKRRDVDVVENAKRRTIYFNAGEVWVRRL